MVVQMIHKHHSDRLRRIIEGRLGLSEYLRRKMLEALDLVDRGAHGGRAIVRAIMRDLRPKGKEKGTGAGIVLTPQNIGRENDEPSKGLSKTEAP